MRDTGASREGILGRLRAAVGRHAAPSRRVETGAVERPADAGELAKEFADRAAFAGAVVTRIASPGDAGGAAVSFMKESGLSSALLSAERIVVESDIGAALSAAGIRVTVQGSDPVSHREASFSADAGVTGAFAGIAETGTVVLCLGDGYSRLISLAPFVHIVLLRVGDIVADSHRFRALMADGAYYARRRAADFGGPVAGTGKTSLPGKGPAGFVFVTGPSSTSDIALTPTKGIHGPGRLLVLLMDR